MPAQRASADTRERLVAFCARWLGGGDARLRRAAIQALGLLAAVEGRRVGRRVPALLPPLVGALRAHADQVQFDVCRASREASASWHAC